MTASMAVSAFAASAKVEAAYSSYTAILDAMDNYDVDALKEAFESYAENTDDLDETESGELLELMGGDIDDATMEVFSVLMYAAAIMELEIGYDAFSTEKNIVNAKQLIDKVDTWADNEELNAEMSGFFPDIEALYEEAVAMTEANAGYGLYVLYADLLDAMEGGAVEALTEAVEAFVEPFNDITEEQAEGLGEIFETDAETAVSEMLSNYIRANVYLDFCKKFTAFSDNASGETAKEYVEYYDSIFNDPDFDDEEIEQLINDHYTGHEVVYEEAKVWAEVQDVVDMYSDVEAAIEDRDLASAKDILAQFGELLNAMDDDKWDIAAQITEEDSEELVLEMLYIYITANVLVSVEEVYDAYVAEQNEETAQAFVDMYDSIYNDSSYEDENLRAIVPEFFTGFEEMYEEAKVFLAGEEESEEETTVEETTVEETEKATEETTEKETSKNTAPGTGDVATALPIVGMLAASVAVAARKKKEA